MTNKLAVTDMGILEATKATYIRTMSMLVNFITAGDNVAKTGVVASEVALDKMTNIQLEQKLLDKQHLQLLEIAYATELKAAQPKPQPKSKQS